MQNKAENKIARHSEYLSVFYYLKYKGRWRFRIIDVHPLQERKLISLSHLCRKILQVRTVSQGAKPAKHTYPKNTSRLKYIKSTGNGIPKEICPCVLQQTSIRST